MKILKTTIKAFSIFALVLGVLYPLFIIIIGKTFFPKKANGSLIEKNGKIIGSSLIAQKFSSPKYFHSRPSAVNYNAASSGGSNLAASSKTLYKKMKTRVKKIRKENGLGSNLHIPTDAISCSGSGLDPHISAKNAFMQLPRILMHRNLTREEIADLVYENMDIDFLGIWGDAGVNVLKLNLALDKAETSLREPQS